MSHDIRLLVRADDAGSSWSGNTGCFRACTDGIVRSVEVMMPCAWTLHAAQLFNARDDIDIGIHLTLTSEWDAMKWPPLTPAKTLIDENGNFLPLLQRREGDQRTSLEDVTWSLDEIAAEFRAQIALGKAMFDNVSHISSHMLRHFKDFDPRLGAVISDLCTEFGLADDALGHGLTRIEGYPAFPRDADARIHAFVAQLNRLEAGTYLFLDHPAVTSPELSATGHGEYRDVAADRVSCLETLTSDAVKECIHDRGITLISYQDL